MQTLFTDITTCQLYINKLNVVLTNKGFPAASVDSIWENFDTTHINLFLGSQYLWIKLGVDNIEKKAIVESGYFEKNFSNKGLNMEQLHEIQIRTLNYYQKNGYPFAQIFLDSINLFLFRFYCHS
ncbi:MAG: hypothetical protein WCG67_07865 [Ferruginibacter sp.]